MGYEHVIPEFAVRMMELVDGGGSKFRIQGSGEETRSFCFVNDCVDAFMVAYEKGEDRNVYHVGNPREERAIRDLALDVADWFGHQIDIVPGKLPKGSPTRRLPDISKLEALGYQPKVSLQDGLDPTLSWYEGAAA
jgi:nucleoside-diphosphate-sugar epimerase